MTGPKKLSLLELMSPPQGQTLRAAVLTTFDLDLDYLERFVLPTMVGLNVVGADEESALPTATNLELRNRLRKAQVAVLADKRRFDFSAKKTMETYELLFAETYPAFHPKLFLLCYEKDFRLIIASANLTEPGFHSNLEVIWHASKANGDRFGNLAEHALNFLSSLAAREWPRSQALPQTLDELRHQLPKRNSSARLLHSGGSLSLLDQWKQDMKTTAFFDEVHIIAPFFDKSGALSLLNHLPSATVNLYATETSLKGQPKFHLRITQKTLSRLRPTIKVIDPGWLQTSDDTTLPLKVSGRVLHAKVYAARTGRKGWVLLGSPNFSHHALTATGSQQNAEVAVALSGKWSSIRRFLPPANREISWKEIAAWTPEDEDEITPWVPFLQSAEFDPTEKKLALVFSRGRPRARWAVKYQKDVLLEGGSSAFPSRKVLPFQLADANSLQVLEGSERGWFPIGVKDKEMLSELPGVSLLGYEDILDLLAHGVVNLGQLAKRLRARKEPNSPSNNGDDKIAYVEQLSMFIKAMEMMKRRLSAYLTTQGETKSLFEGDLGFNRVVEGIHSDRVVDTIFRLFALLELRSVLASITWKGRPHIVRFANKLSQRAKKSLADHIRTAEKTIAPIPIEITRLRQLYAKAGASGWRRRYEPY